MKKYSLALLTLSLLMFGSATQAERLELPKGMGGVADIGTVPCEVFTRMLVIGPKGTRLSLLTWADGYYYARTEMTLDEIVAAANKSGESWDFERLTDHFAEFCAANPEAITRDAVVSLGTQLISKPS
jgi:hypothetical protein